MKLRESYSALKQSYLVRNLIFPTSQYVFILESPHVEELKHGVPVAGRSGRSMTHILFRNDFDVPLGRLLLAHQRNAADHPLLSRLGLANTCQIPMQPAAYPDDTREQFGDFLTTLEAIRSRPASKIYRDERLNVVRDLILSDLRRQLQALIQRELHLIPCGRVAETFLSLAAITSPNWHLHAGIPHPARNQWHRDDVTQRVRSILRF